MGTLVELVYSMFAELSRSDNSRGSDGEQQSTSKTSAEAEHGKTSDNCWEYPKAAHI